MQKHSRLKLNYACLYSDGCYISSCVSEERRRRALKHHVKSNGDENKNYVDSLTFLTLLRECTRNKDPAEGSRIHAHILERGLIGNSPHLGRSLVIMYAKCGMLWKARQVLEGLPIRDVISWSTVISEYAKQGCGHEALNCFDQMLSEGFSPDAVTFTCALKACGSVGAIEIGKRIHDEIVHRGLLEKDIFLGNSLIGMYVKCGRLAKAQQVLDELPLRNTISWSALISGYADQGFADEAFNCFEQMQREGLLPDAISFICVLKACSNMRSLDKGRQIHDEIVSRGLLEKEVELGNALVDMYTKCGVLAKAQQVLEGLRVRNTISWNTLITGYVLQGKCDEALNCFKQMKNEGLPPDGVTFICTLKACGVIRDIDMGKQIHREIIKRGLLRKDIIIGNALVDMYVKCGMLLQAKQVLQKLPIQDVVSWNTLISGFLFDGKFREVLNCFEEMHRDGLTPDVVTFVCILKACGGLGAIKKGTRIHEEVVRKGFFEKDVVVGTALVDMYAKSGMLAKAQQIIEELPVRNVISWSALISGYAEQGKSHEALSCFECMQSEGFSPDAVTFLSVLIACGNSGCFHESETLFGNMSKKYGVIPNIDHHTCMVVTLCYAGNFENAMSMIKMIPCFHHLDIWLAFLGACKKWGNVKFAILAFDQVLQLDITCAAAYDFLASIFSADGMQEDAYRVRAMRVKSTDVRKFRTCK